MESIVMTKKGIAYLVVAPAIALVAGFALLSTYTGTDKPVSFDDKEAASSPSDTAEAPAADAPLQAPAESGAAEAGSGESESAEPEPVAVDTTEEQSVIGQFMRFKEIRETEDGAPEGAIRNMKFVFRPGIVPSMLFENNNQVILKYEQLHRNMVGSGAKTAFFYYEVVRRDTNGDGKLSHGDKFNVAISRPDGNNYRVLAYNVDEVVEYEDMPVENQIRLVVKIQGKEIEKTYSLEGM